MRPRSRPDAHREPPLAIAFERGIVVRSLKVALVVGSVLVAINQGDRILAGGAPDWLKLVLTFCVPYCVATYGAVTARRDRH